MLVALLKEYGLAFFLLFVCVLVVLMMLVSNESERRRVEWMGSEVVDEMQRR